MDGTRENSIGHASVEQDATSISAISSTLDYEKQMHQEGFKPPGGAMAAAHQTGIARKALTLITCASCAAMGRDDTPVQGIAPGKIRNNSNKHVGK
ncbi:hypothetical protein [Xylella fastidiosa]|uniref:hypothetical protein n=1 Tax=Xylella fastidiosa TaxID=2371 RepID=UPI0003D33C83|nr:hypothetical protein [Xylella fastidiosa]ETE34977.1 hypothetical protein B398_02590 [Xylella fastidiosa 32]MDG5823716.1 hypothetical protein [Xylella fastidiosa subsp. pauca]MDG5825014.1 hypothetical protein [Xylella fastidiosa subsp. pauca]WGZ32503.1 hypothetical protein O4444_02435 [Xylella fastidiosa subsp. pauca]WGZ34833.1 hypothetical protein O4445_02710 [Xylella fastidiosa subsp. pauca]